jgi:hypothetical protein
VDGRKPTSNVHASELRESLEPIQTFKLDNSLQVIQHSRNATPLSQIGLVDVVTVQMQNRGDCSSERTIVVDSVVISTGELEGTIDMRDDILQCIKVPGIKESLRARHSDSEGY